MYLCVRGVDFASLYDFDISFLNCSDSVVFFCVVHFITGIYCESTFIGCHQFSWLLQNTLSLGFLNSCFQTLHATINGEIVF